MKRRKFIMNATLLSAGLTSIGMGAFPIGNSFTIEDKLFFKLSLAQWSLHKALFDKKMDNLDFAAKSRAFGCEGIEYVNAFFKDKAKDMAYLKEMNKRAENEGQQNVLIMIDGEGDLADANTENRLKGIENHFKWVEAAHFLGCHAIRVNLRGGKEMSEAANASVDSLTKLSDFAKGSGISVLVENHGGFSSNGVWMTDVFSRIKNENCGTLPDFGNFCITRKDNNCIEEYDKYKGMEQLLPFAKAMSAKSNVFDDQGNERNIDYYKIMKMVKDSGYRGFVGIEYEGNEVSEEKGIELTRDLLIKVGKELA